MKVVAIDGRRFVVALDLGELLATRPLGARAPSRRDRATLWYSSPSVALAAFPDTPSAQPTLRSRQE
jgi:hypothetical protein